MAAGWGAGVTTAAGTCIGLAARGLLAGAIWILIRGAVELVVGGTTRRKVNSGNGAGSVDCAPTMAGTVTHTTKTIRLMYRNITALPVIFHEVCLTNRRFDSHDPQFNFWAAKDQISSIPHNLLIIYDKFLGVNLLLIYVA
jgi:hypothetical protein